MFIYDAQTKKIQIFFDWKKISNYFCLVLFWKFEFSLNFFFWYALKSVFVIISLFIICLWILNFICHFIFEYASNFICEWILLFMRKCLLLWNGPINEIFHLMIFLILLQMIISILIEWICLRLFFHCFKELIVANFVC